MKRKGRFLSILLIFCMVVSLSGNTLRADRTVFLSEARAASVESAGAGTTEMAAPADPSGNEDAAGDLSVPAETEEETAEEAADTGSASDALEHPDTETAPGEDEEDEEDDDKKDEEKDEEKDEGETAEETEEESEEKIEEETEEEETEEEDSADPAQNADASDGKNGKETDQEQDSGDDGVTDTPEEESRTDSQETETENPQQKDDAQEDTQEDAQDDAQEDTQEDAQEDTQENTQEDKKEPADAQETDVLTDAEDSTAADSTAEDLTAGEALAADESPVLQTIRARIEDPQLFDKKGNPTEPVSRVSAFWNELFGRSPLTAAERTEKYRRKDTDITVEITGVLPQGVTAAAGFIAFEEDDIYSEKALFALELELYDAQGNVYVPQDDPDNKEGIVVTIGGKLLSGALKKDMPVLVYQVDEDEKKKNRSDGDFAADVRVYRDGSGDDGRLRYEMEDVRKDKKNLQFTEDKDGITVYDDNTVDFAVRPAYFADAVHLVLSAQVTERTLHASDKKSDTSVDVAGALSGSTSVSVSSSETSGTDLRDYEPEADKESLLAVDITLQEKEAGEYVPDLPVEITITDPAIGEAIAQGAQDAQGTQGGDAAAGGKTFFTTDGEEEDGEDSAGTADGSGGNASEGMAPAGASLELWQVPEEGDPVRVEDAVFEGSSVTFAGEGALSYVIVRTVLEKTLEASDGNTYRVTVSYDANAGLPADAALEVVELTGEEYDKYAALTAKAMETESVAYARIFDICIVSADGTHYQPDADVTVSIALMGDSRAEDEMSVVHFGKKTEILESVQEGDTVTFRTDGFSVYALGSYHLRTYRFITYESASNMQYVEYHMYTDADDTTFTQIIKSADEGLVAPKLPSLEGSSTSTFSGWYADEGTTETYEEDGTTYYTPGALSDTAFDFENIPDVTATETVYLFAKFADYGYVVFHDQFNGTTHTFPVAETRRGEKVSGAASIRISDVSVAYDDDSGTNSAPGYAFYGWSYTSITVPGSETDDDGNAVSRITADTIEITETTHLYPIFQPIHWLTCYSGPTGSGATYIPSAYYYEGEGPDHLSVPVRGGYTFDGWYLGSLTTADNGDGTTTETVTYGTQIADSDGALINGASGDDISVSGGTLLLTGNVTIYAKWSEAAVNYSIVIWRQSANDAAGIADSEKTYDYAESVTLTGISGTTVSVANTYKNYAGSGDYVGFTYSRCDDSKTIASDGSTALNVYYDRVCYTVKFYFARSNSAGTGSFAVSTNTSTLSTWTSNNSWQSVTASDITAICTNTANVGYTTSGSYRYYYYYITANYGADISSQWPSYDDFPKIGSYNLVSWVLMTGAKAITGSGSGANTVKGLIATMDEKILGDPSSADGNFLTASYSSQSPNSWTYKIYYPVLEGETYSDTVTRNGTEYYLADTIAARSRGTSSTSQHAPSYVGYTYADEQQSGYVMNYYYARESYNLEFWDSYTHQMVYIDDTQQSAISVPYADKLAGYVIDDPTPKTIVNVDGTITAQDRGGYSFTGWYADEGCSTRVFFSASDSTYQYYVSKGYSCVLYDTMPARPVKVYAGWETIWYKVVIDPNYGWLNDGTGTGSTWFWEPYNGDPIQEYTWVARDYVESASGTYYYHYDNRSDRWPDEWSSEEDDDRQRYAYYTEDPGEATDLTTFKYSQNAYRYAGWYEVDQDTGEETLYNFGEPITHDTYLVLHWKKIGTYSVEYNAVVEQDGTEIAGTLDSGDSNETLYVELDEGDYADNADVVVTRTAKAPEGYNFVGWTIRNDDSGTIYYPGQSFILLAKYTSTVNGKETIFLDAVYTRIGTAQIIYSANGGSITGTPDYGEPADEDAPAPVTSWNADAGTAVIKNLVNNSAINLSDGTGFTMENAVLTGWNTAIDGSGTHYDLDGDYYVDTEDPVTLYAEWQVKVYYHLNHTDTNWGGTWDDVDSEGNQIFTYDAEADVYYQTLLVNNAAAAPSVVPQYTGTEDLTFRYWGTIRYSTDTPEAYDFSTPVTGELHLYGYWAAPVQLPVHVVDSTEETMAEETSWRITEAIEVSSGTTCQVGTESDAAAYTQVPESPSYAYAFAAIKKSTDDLSTLSEDKAITAVYYNVTERCLYVTYADTSREDEALADTDELYFVYYQDPETLEIGYRWMDTDRSLDEISVSPDAPETASVNPEGHDHYAMADYVTGPLSYLTGTDRDTYKYYAYAIGEADAAGDTALRLVTSAVSTDSTRPALYVKNTWRGFAYSSDGDSWTGTGYSANLYVIYFKAMPTVLTLHEQTIGTAEDMDEEFTYAAVITQTETTTVQTQVRTRTRGCYRYGWNWSWYDWDDGGWTEYTDVGDAAVTPGASSALSSETYRLSSGESETITAFYVPGSVSETEEEAETTGSTSPGRNATQTQTQYKTVTTTVVTQTVTITQTKKDDFDVDHDGTGTHRVSSTVYTFTTTASSSSEDPEVTYTNIRPTQTVEIHVAVVGSGGTITLDDDERAASGYTITVPIDYPTVNADHTKTFLTEVPSADLFTGDSTYGFAGVIYGSSTDGQGDTVTAAGSGIKKVTFGHIRDTVYELYFDGNTSLLMGDYKVYYLYYPLPKVVYAKETSGGALTRIQGSTDGSTVSDTVTYNGSSLTLNGTSVAQEQLLSVATDLFTVSQTVAAGNFNMPPLLDDGTDRLYLTYSKIGVAGTANVSNTGSLALASETKLLYLKVTDNQVKWSVDKSTWTSFDGTAPTVYAIYKEKGYSLEVIKSLADDTGNTGSRTFTVTLRSPAIIESSYEVTGTGYTTIAATPASGSTPGKITLTMRGGTGAVGHDIKISGLAKGDYTITETEDAGYTLSARAGNAGSTRSDVSVTDNTTLAPITLDADKEVVLTNTRRYVEITVKKSLADTTDTGLFGFTAVLTDNQSPVNAKTFGTGTAETRTDSTGTVLSGEETVFYLAHDGTRILTVPVGSVLVITESAAKDTSDNAVDIDNYTVTMAAVETGTDTVYSGTPDEDNKTYTLNTVPDRALTITFTNSSGIDIQFAKIDGFGNGLDDAVFTLYTDAACTSELQAAGTAVTGTSADGVVTFNNKVPNGVCYMKETTVPEGYINGSTYIVLAGDKALAKEGLDETAEAYLTGISTTDIAGQTALYSETYRNDESEYDKYAIFLIDTESGEKSDTYGKAVVTPDIAKYGVLNTSVTQRKELFKKADSSTGQALDGAKFDILRYDRLVIAKDCGTTDSGVYWIGTLPIGTYYVHETKVPDGYDKLPDTDDNWFSVTVNADGTTTTEPLEEAP